MRHYHYWISLILTGYYNPLLAYGEDKSIHDASEAGANGFIIVDLPPEEAMSFRQKCSKVKCAPPYVRASSNRNVLNVFIVSHTSP